MKFFLHKDFSNSDLVSIIKDVPIFEYEKCHHCGFVASKTLYDMEYGRWELLNEEFHRLQETKETQINQPPYLQQALMMAVLGENGLIVPNENCLDYAGGLGTLAKLLEKYWSISIKVFDPYIVDEAKDFYLSEQELKEFDLVLNSALFEHLRTREQFDGIHKLVSEGGALAIHTVICEEIPENPDWFYFAPPVHCSFHTNKSMGLLMQQWGYKSSIYCPEAKMWILFKNTLAQTVVSSINSELQREYLFYKDGFMDYWK